MTFTFWGQVLNIAFLIPFTIVILWFVPIFVSVWKTYHANKE